MSFPTTEGFVLALPIGAISEMSCAVPAVAAWTMTARLATGVRYLVVAVAAAAGVGYLALETGDLSWGTAELAGGAALAAAVFAPSITSRPAAAANDARQETRGPEISS